VLDAFLPLGPEPERRLGRGIERHVDSDHYPRRVVAFERTLVLRINNIY
jgi:hypothetical protein